MVLLHFRFMILCKFCQNKTDNTSGICWDCINKNKISKNKFIKNLQEWAYLRKTAKKLRKDGHYVIVYDIFFMAKRKLKFFCGIFWNHQMYTNKENELKCAICELK